MRKHRMSSLLICCTVLAASVLTAQTQSWDLNIKAGLLLPGTVTISPPGVDLDTETGFIAQTNLDALVAPKLSVGARVVLASTSEEISGEGATVYSFGGTIKARFRLSSGWQVRPGIAFAYQLCIGESFEDVEGLDLGLIFEIVKPLNAHQAVLADIGFISQPAGGNEDADVTFAPIFYLTLGFEFGG